MTKNTKFDEHDNLSSVIGRLAGTICSPDFPTDERAAFRRMRPGAPPPLAFLKFAFKHLPVEWEYRVDAWITLVAGIGIMSPTAHRNDYSAGFAMAAAGYSEARLERLLSAENETLLALILRLSRFMKAKTTSFNWSHLGYLVLTSDPKKKEDARLLIAKDYYRSVYKKED